jgi:hypothetical protein
MPTGLAVSTKGHNQLFSIEKYIDPLQSVVN